MKRFFLLLLFIGSFHSLFGENIGLRMTSIFSKNKEMSGALGAGLYIQLNDSLDKIGCYMYGDFLTKKIDWSPHDLFTTYKNKSFGFSVYYSVKSFSNFKIKIGPSIYYSNTNAIRQGRYFQWIDQFHLKSIGTGLLFNFQFKQIFKSKFNFDVFATPTYLINIETEYPLQTDSYYSDNPMVINLQIGISYIIK